MIRLWIQKMYLTLNQQHDEDQQEIHLTRDALIGCTDAASVGLDEVDGYYNAVVQDRQSHDDCRQGEVMNKQNHTTLCQDYTAYRKTSPYRIPPDCLQTKLTLDYIQSSDEDMTQAMESCLEDTQPWLIPLHKKYMLCKEAKEITANKTRECDAHQGTFEQVFCAYAAKLKHTCEEQESCFNNLLPQQETTHHEVRLSEAARKSEFETGQKIMCLFLVFDANNTDKSTTMSTCENTTFNASNYTIVYHPAPLPVTCNKESHQPCESQFLQQEYQGKNWSTDAPATTCHSCPAPATTTSTTTTVQAVSQFIKWGTDGWDKPHFSNGGRNVWVADKCSDSNQYWIKSNLATDPITRAGPRIGVRYKCSHNNLGPCITKATSAKMTYASWTWGPDMGEGYFCLKCRPDGKPDIFDKPSSTELKQINNQIEPTTALSSVLEMRISSEGFMEYLVDGRLEYTSLEEVDPNTVYHFGIAWFQKDAVNSSVQDISYVVKA